MTLNQAAMRASFVFTLFQLIGCESSEYYQKQLSASSTMPDPGFNDPTNNPTPNPTPTVGVGVQDKIDSFTQNSEEYGNVDILWVVDDSGSMADEQASLANNFGVFIDRFKDQDINFKMGIITTDPRAGYAGIPVAGSLNLLTYANAQADEAGFINNFMDMVQVGIAGSGSEKGLSTSKTFFQNNAAWLRDDAYLAVIYVSDEEDQSPETVTHYVNYLKGLKSNPDKVKAHVIVDVNGTQNNGATKGSVRYKAAANATNGSINEITSNFGTSLDNIAEQIVQLTQSFTLSSPAIADSIHVIVDGVESYDWSFDAATNSIQFDAAHVPDSGSDIEVEYQTE